MKRLPELMRGMLWLHFVWTMIEGLKDFLEVRCKYLSVLFV